MTKPIQWPPMRVKLTCGCRPVWDGTAWNYSNAWAHGMGEKIHEHVQLNCIAYRQSSGHVAAGMAIAYSQGWRPAK